MRRRVFTILSVVSLVLCVAVVGVWGRSYERADEWSRARIPDEWVECAAPFGWVPVKQVRVRHVGVVYGRVYVGESCYTARPHHITHHDGQWVHASRASGSVWWPVERRYASVGSWQERFGFGTCRATWDRGWVARGAAMAPMESHQFRWFPLWPLVVVTAALPVAFFSKLARSVWRKRRASRGFCAACGYDLRATPGRCPECGREAGAM